MPPTCGNPCTTATVDKDCLEGQRCRLFKDKCHMTCENVTKGTRNLHFFE